MATKKPEVEAVDPEPTGAPEAPLNAVIIVKDVDPEGNITTRVALNGNVNALEVHTLIEFGLKAWREQVGLSD